MMQMGIRSPQVVLKSLAYCFRYRYCRGDGIGSLVVKRLEDAEADNDRILAVILETQTNHSANAISITHPHAPTQESLFRKVMDDAGVDPYEVNYVEMHGTGTQGSELHCFQQGWRFLTNFLLSRR